MNAESTVVVFIAMLFLASGRNLMIHPLLEKEKESHPLDTTFNPRSGQLLDEFLPKVSWILAISLVCSAKHSLQVFYLVRKQSMRRPYLSPSRITLPKMKTTLLLRHLKEI